MSELSQYQTKCYKTFIRIQSNSHSVNIVKAYLGIIFLKKIKELRESRVLEKLDKIIHPKDWKDGQTMIKNTAKITSFSECFVSYFSCLAQGSAVSLPYH